MHREQWIAETARKVLTTAIAHAKGFHDSFCADAVGIAIELTKALAAKGCTPWPTEDEDGFSIDEARVIFRQGWPFCPACGLTRLGPGLDYCCEKMADAGAWRDGLFYFGGNPAAFSLQWPDGGPKARRQAEGGAPCEA